MRYRIQAICVLVLVCIPALAAAQWRSIYSNLANPAIGMNSLFSGQAASDLDEPYAFHFDEAELSMISDVDHVWTFNTNIVFTGNGEVDPEEVWARTNSIPGVQIKVGKLRGTFGKQGLLHSHAYPFIQGPVIMENTIGGEGFKGAGLEASWLTPLPWYGELTGGVFEATPSDDEHPLDFGDPSHGNIPFLFHYKNVFDLNESTTMEIGASTLQGHGVDGTRNAAYGANFTLRNVPLRQSNQRGWIFQAEYLEKANYDGGDYHKESHGWYTQFQYRMSQKWWLGLRGEQARDIETDVLVDPAGDPLSGKMTRGSFNIAWTPSEFSYVRLEYSLGQADDGLGFQPWDHRLMIQMSTTIGYHPAHAY